MSQEPLPSGSTAHVAACTHVLQRTLVLLQPAAKLGSATGVHTQIGCTCTSPSGTVIERVFEKHFLPAWAQLPAPHIRSSIAGTCRWIDYSSQRPCEMVAHMHADRPLQSDGYVKMSQQQCLELEPFYGGMLHLQSCKWPWSLSLCSRWRWYNERFWISHEHDEPKAFDACSLRPCRNGFVLRPKCNA